MQFSFEAISQTQRFNFEIGLDNAEFLGKWDVRAVALEEISKDLSEVQNEAARFERFAVDGSVKSIERVE